MDNKLCDRCQAVSHDVNWYYVDTRKNARRYVFICHSCYQAWAKTRHSLKFLAGTIIHETQ